MAEEEVGDSWEDIEEEDLIRRLTTRQQELSKQSRDSDSLVITCSSSNSSNERTFIDGPMKIKYSEGSEYVAPIKILKRQPENAPQSTCTPSTEHHRIQKTLAEREAEYATARARILGNDSNSSPTKTTSEKILVQRHSPKS